MSALPLPGIRRAVRPARFPLYNRRGDPLADGLRHAGYLLARVDPGVEGKNLFAFMDQIERGLTRENVPVVYRHLCQGIAAKGFGTPPRVTHWQDDGDLPSFLIRNLVRAHGWEFVTLTVCTHHRRRGRLEAYLEEGRLCYFWDPPDQRGKFYLRAGVEALLPRDPRLYQPHLTQFCFRDQQGSEGWKIRYVFTTAP